MWGMSHHELCTFLKIDITRCVVPVHFPFFSFLLFHSNIEVVAGGGCFFHV